MIGCVNIRWTNLLISVLVCSAAVGCAHTSSAQPFTDQRIQPVAGYTSQVAPVDVTSNKNEALRPSESAQTPMKNQTESENSLQSSDAFSLPPPFSPQEFWGKFVQLVSARQGFIEPEDFEKIFSVKMIKGADDADAKGFGVYAGKQWFFYVGLLLTTAQYEGLPGTNAPGISSIAIFRFPENAFGDWKRGQCILAGEAIEKLIKAGWRMYIKKSTLQGLGRDSTLDRLIMGNGYVSIKHYLYYVSGHEKNDDATCITEVSVGGRPE